MNDSSEHFLCISGIFFSILHDPSHPISSYPTPDNLCPHIQLFISGVSQQGGDDDDENHSDIYDEKKVLKILSIHLRLPSFYQLVEDDEDNDDNVDDDNRKDN